MRCCARPPALIAYAWCEVDQRVLSTSADGRELVFIESGSFVVDSLGCVGAATKTRQSWCHWRFRNSQARERFGSARIEKFRRNPDFSDETAQAGATRRKAPDAVVVTTQARRTGCNLVRGTHVKKGRRDRAARSCEMVCDLTCGRVRSGPELPDGHRGAVRFCRPFPSCAQFYRAHQKKPGRHTSRRNRRPSDPGLTCAECKRECPARWP